MPPSDGMVGNLLFAHALHGASTGPFVVVKIIVWVWINMLSLGRRHTIILIDFHFEHRGHYLHGLQIVPNFTLSLTKHFNALVEKYVKNIVIFTDLSSNRHIDFFSNHQIVYKYYKLALLFNSVYIFFSLCTQLLINCSVSFSIFDWYYYQLNSYFMRLSKCYTVVCAMEWRSNHYQWSHLVS